MSKKTDTPEVKRLPLNQDSFQTKNHVYYFLDALPISRYRIYESLTPEMAFGTTFSGIMDTFREIEKASKDWEKPGQAFHKIWELTYNQMRAIGQFNEHEHSHILKFCTVFIVRSDEEIEKWDERIALEKMEDWTAEGFAMEDFFQLAFGRISKFRENYIWLFQNELGLSTEAVASLIKENRETN